MSWVTEVAATAAAAAVAVAAVVAAVAVAAGEFVAEARGAEKESMQDAEVAAVLEFVAASPALDRAAAVFVVVAAAAEATP